MIAFINKYQTVIFITINLLITGFSIVIMQSDYIPQWMPGLTALLIVNILSKKKGLISILKRLKSRKADFKWITVSLIMPMGVLFAVYMVINTIQENKLLGISLVHNWLDYILGFVFILIGSIGEEIGWRGFLLPNLLKSYSFLKSSVILGFIWGLWHFRFDSGIVNFVLYILFTIETSIILSWLYCKTNGSILTAILYHTTINTCALVLFEKILMDSNARQTEVLFFGLCCLFFAVPGILIIHTGKKKSSH